MANVRRRRGLTQDRLSDLSGVSRKTIYLIEAGRVRPRRVTVLVLAAALGCTIGELEAQR